MIDLDLDEPPVVVTAGVPLFADALVQQAAAPREVEWAPPVPDTSSDLAAIAADPRTAAATAESARRLTTARPHWVDVRPASEVLGLGPREFLHAGPPVTWADASGPLRGALAGAMVYEGLADNVEEAERIAASGGVSLAPCHSRGDGRPDGRRRQCVDADVGAAGRRARRPRVLHAQRGAGQGTALRRLLRGGHRQAALDAARARSAAREHAAQAGPVDVRSLIAQALQMGDECHNRNRAATSLLLREITPDLLETGASTADIAAAAFRFISGNDHFFLNLSMPAGKAAADAARDIPGSTMVVAMARNGTDFGIQVSGTGDEWFTAPAPVVDGLFLSGFGPEDANPDIGDSTITETSGIGGFAMAAAPAIVRFVGGDVSDALHNTLPMYEITLAEHPMYQVPGARVPRNAVRHRRDARRAQRHRAGRQHRHRRTRARRGTGRRRTGDPTDVRVRRRGARTCPTGELRRGRHDALQVPGAECRGRNCSACSPTTRPCA